MPIINTANYYNKYSNNTVKLFVNVRLKQKQIYYPEIN